MAVWTCDVCGNAFVRETSKKAKARFCSTECYRKWQKEHPNAGTFCAQDTPWNKGMKGLHLSPSTQFQKGRPNNRKLMLGSVRIRTTKRGGAKQRAYVKIGEPNIWQLRAIVVWEAHYGKFPEGKVLHHIDKNPLNDAVDNLAAVTRSEHINLHRDELRPIE